VTVIAASGFENEAAAKDWLERCRRNQVDRNELVDAAVLVVNRAIHGHRVAGLDPYVRDVSPAQAQALRIGYGTGDDVVDGHWRDAYDLHPETGADPTRRKMLAPQEELAGILSGKRPTYVSDDLALRARLDLEQGRPEQAAVQLRACLDALTAESTRDEHPIKGGAAAVQKQAAATRALAAAALEGKLSEDRVAELRETVTQVERLLRRRRYGGSTAR
jgi:HPt (histidine-containing phosphotransfer) domain-containing protein